MALREKLVERVQPYLEEGEQVEQVFTAQSGPNPYWFFLTWIIAFMVKYRIVAVTNKNIVVLESAKTGYKPKALLAREPLATRLGPMSGLWGTTELAGEKMYVHKRFHKDVAAADAALDAGSGPAATA